MNNQPLTRWQEHQDAAHRLAVRLKPGDRVQVAVLEDLAPSYESEIPNLVPVLYPAVVERLDDDVLTVVLDGVLRRGEHVVVTVDDLRP